MENKKTKTQASAEVIEKKVTIAKKEKKDSKKIAGEKKPVMVEKKVVKKEKRKKNDFEKKVLKIKKTISQKKHPKFRGRFGGRFKRKKTKEKWNKWRRPRGIDILFKKEDGALPKIGYRVPKAIRFLHPSGLKEVLVSNPKELSKIQDSTIAVRFAGKIGKRKRIEMLKNAKEKNLKVLNRWKR